VRIHQSEILKHRLQRSGMYATLQKRGLGLAQFADYLGHMEQFGPVIGEHYGFGVGLDRVVQYLMSETDIRRCAGFVVGADIPAEETPRRGEPVSDDSGNGHHTEPAVVAAALVEV
jgi:aspartyl-tRNA synthetase